MKHTYNISGMTCDGCRSSVHKSLSELENIEKVTVNLEQEEATINMSSHVSIEILQNALPEKFTIAKKKEKKKIPDVAFEEKKSKSEQLYPLFLIFGYILVSSVLMNINPWETNAFMLDFMGLFYIIFSFFKILDVKGFAMSFQMYDPLAKVIPKYAFVYPFIELSLGLLFLFEYKIRFALFATLVILGITTVGVIKSLLDKKTIKCACLGSVLNLPMTKATFIENSIMILMAIYMLVTLY
ncbi:heavy-metal-associated domain-containing protein [Polaribacter septentrionalilitoris]|uniref:heavy-metal-associated domain-containing protein n=1 Tax=Polaribacter septentrionalilitoris TaxID=2494657 RepID=UPI00135B02B7|nr:heavy metal-associated domain-containing protein [Polaribacter septentrionalilitoris]